MKLKRVKAYKKLMGYLQFNFNFREPYQVLVDEEILLDAVASKYDVVAGLERTLQGKVKPMITQCTIEHLYRAKTPEAKEAIKLAKTFERRRCGHISKEEVITGASKSPATNETGEDDEKNGDKIGEKAQEKVQEKIAKKPTPLSAFECIAEVVGDTNKHRYAVATQKPKLRQKLRSIAAVPLIYLSRSVMILEPMSKTTIKARKEMEEKKLTGGLNAVHTTFENSSTNFDMNQRGRKVKKAKEPNPLSVRKRKRSESEQEDGGKKRRRGKRGSGKVTQDA